MDNEAIHKARYKLMATLMTVAGSPQDLAADIESLIDAKIDLAIAKQSPATQDGAVRLLDGRVLKQRSR